MKEYPKIPAAQDILSEHEGEAVTVFDKLDGSNIRAEWNPRTGWYKFGSRRQLLSDSDPVLGPAIKLIKDTYGDDLARIFLYEKALKKPTQVTAYFEYLGPHSFAGQHEPGVLKVESNDPMKVVLIDVNLHKRGFLPATDFIEFFGHLQIPKVIGQFPCTQSLIDDVRADRFSTDEGVICKGGKGHKMWMAKIKTNKYMARLKEWFKNDWASHWE